MAELIPAENYVVGAPSDQNAIDLMEGWVSKFPESFGVGAAGTYASLFDDARVTWAIDRMGGVAGKRILELGPLEGGHTYMLHQAGAASILSIEASKRGFLKCLIMKNALDLSRAQFLLGNFVPWLEQSNEKFDAIWASGVLYHMTEPVRLLELIAAHTDKTYIWTHYVPGDYRRGEPWAAPILNEEVRHRAGLPITHYVRSYVNAQASPAYCGGAFTHSIWLKRGDILKVLSAVGLSDIQISLEQLDHPSGPCFGLVASRPGA